MRSTPTLSSNNSLLNFTSYNQLSDLNKLGSKKDLSHRHFRADEFWRIIPAYKDVSRMEFMDYKFQLKNSITSISKLDGILKDITEPKLMQDIKNGLSKAPMNIRISPYILSLIDWKQPCHDPIRTQFLPLASTWLPNHPLLKLDSLHEQQDSPVSGLVHRYQDKALFLALDVCPVYCRFCTRSYAIGNDTETVSKLSFSSNLSRWDDVFSYLSSHIEIEDVVVSGGDIYLLPAQYLEYIGENLLAIPHIRRIRFASKGLAVMPMKILTDLEWTDTLTAIVQKGRKLQKEVCFHTHFNTANEITDITRLAMNMLFERGIKVRNQAVLIRGVNDSVEAMIGLTRKLSYLNVQPYYVYQHDMVSGVEELRTSVATSIEIERHVRGCTAGFNTPTFVLDAPGGGGKRDLHSFDYYSQETGISVYRSPSVDKDRVYLYFDPLHSLSEDMQKAWQDQAQQRLMIKEALEQSGLKHFKMAQSSF